MKIQAVNTNSFCGLLSIKRAHDSQCYIQKKGPEEDDFKNIAELTLNTDLVESIEAAAEIVDPTPPQTLSSYVLINMSSGIKYKVPHCDYKEFIAAVNKADSKKSYNLEI